LRGFPERPQRIIAYSTFDLQNPKKNQIERRTCLILHYGPSIFLSICSPTQFTIEYALPSRIGAHTNQQLRHAPNFSSLVEPE
jgi:hypothetical protein